MLASLGVGGGICCRPEGYRGRLGSSSKNLTTMKLISQPSREIRQMVQCLELYYKQARSQKDIAVALGVSAATVSRLLKRAMDEGLVRVELDLPRTPELETALAERFGLRDAVVVSAGGRADVREELGLAAATYFEKMAASGLRIGVSCGFTLYQTIRALHERRFRDLSLYPLSGESTLKLVDISPNTLVGMMAAKYRPHVTAYALPVQHLVSLRDIERERRRLLRELGVVGEINYQPFDVEGHLVDHPELRVLMRRMLAVDGDRLRELSRQDDRTVIAVAGGKAKATAVRGALLGRFCNVL